MFCPKCGNDNPDGARFCRSCGDGLPNQQGGQAIDRQPGQLEYVGKKGGSWESAISTLFVGGAFTAISIILSGHPVGFMWWFWMLIPAFACIGSGVAQVIKLKRNKERKDQSRDTWEGVMATSFIGLAFLIVTIVLAFQPVGWAWWFWLLIPSAGIIGSGIGKTIALKERETVEAEFVPAQSSRNISGSNQRELPPDRTVFAEDEVGQRYETGDIVPPSVVEGTTRHLEMESEGKTRPLDEED